MKVVMNASEFAKHSGYPLRTIKTYCEKGIIPHDRIGRKYLINVELADEALMDRMISRPTTKIAAEKKYIPKRAKKFDFLSALKIAAQ